MCDFLTRRVRSGKCGILVKADLEMQGFYPVQSGPLLLTSHHPEPGHATFSSGGVVVLVTRTATIGQPCACHSALQGTRPLISREVSCTEYGVLVVVAVLLVGGVGSRWWEAEPKGADRLRTQRDSLRGGAN